MENLQGKAFQNKLKNDILYALQNAKNPDINILFLFSGVGYDGKNFECKESINYFAGYFRFKGMSLSTSIIPKETIIDLIVSNFHYDSFSFISCIKKIGKEQCHGHGEYWGIDSFTFVYTRI